MVIKVVRKIRRLNCSMFLKITLECYITDTDFSSEELVSKLLSKKSVLSQEIEMINYQKFPLRNINVLAVLL